MDRFLGGADSFPMMTPKATCAMFRMFLRPAERRGCLADLPMRFRRICPSAWPERWPCLVRPAPLRGHKREDQGRTILVLMNHSSRPNFGSDLAHSILLDLKILRERDEKNLAGSPERKDLTLRLWSEMIGQERGWQQTVKDFRHLFSIASYRNAS